MARIFRRKQERHEYYWVLHDWDSRAPYGYWVRIDPQSENAVPDSTGMMLFP